MKTHNGENWIDYQREHTEWFLAIPEEQCAETRILLASSKIINYLAYALPPVTLRGLSKGDIEGVNPKQALQTYLDQLDITHIVVIDRENATYEFFVSATGMELEIDQLYLVDKSVTPYALKAIPHK